MHVKDVIAAPYYLFAYTHTPNVAQCSNGMRP